MIFVILEINAKSVRNMSFVMGRSLTAGSQSRPEIMVKDITKSTICPLYRIITKMTGPGNT